MSYYELEYKYKADEVGLADFKALMNKQNVKKTLDISSYDVYYTRQDNKDFQRFRNSESPELTRKVKTQEGNNWQRVEVDLPLDSARLTEDIVTKYVGLDGYSENFRVFKTCFVYWLDNINFVYYTVYNKDLREVGRFIEVEVNKEDVTDLEQATEILNQAEKILSEIGITSRNRMKKSLFELYVNN